MKKLFALLFIAIITLTLVECETEDNKTPVTPLEPI